jgi:hypothetical protein
MTQKSEPPRYQEHRIGRAVTSKGLEIYLAVRMPVAAKPEQSAWWPRIVRASRAAMALARREM